MNVVLSGQSFTRALARSETEFDPAAAYATWQKGKVERKIEAVKAIIRKTVIFMGLKGRQDMLVAGIEAATAVNQRPGPTGVSPAMLLFGQKMKLYGELYVNGETAGHHPDGDDPNSYLARRFKIRMNSRQVAERWHACKRRHFS